VVDINRRRFLQAGAAVGVGAMAGPFQGFLAGPTPVSAHGRSSYGPLGEAFDQRDGGYRLDLPAGFSYRSFDVARQPWFGLAALPGRPDGMAAFAGRSGTRTTSCATTSSAATKAARSVIPRRPTTLPRREVPQRSSSTAKATCQTVGRR
jgi:hypothetical protein